MDHQWIIILFAKKSFEFGEMRGIHDLISRLSLNNGRGRNRRGQENMMYELRIPELSYLSHLEKNSSVSYLSSAPKAKEIPLTFHSLHQYIEVMENNIEAEYYESIKSAISFANSEKDCWKNYDKGDSSSSMRVRDLTKSSSAADDSDSWSNHLLQIQGTDNLFYARYCDVESGEIRLNVRVPNNEGYVRSLGYVGSYILQFSSARSIKESKLVQMILNPGISKSLKEPGAFLPLDGVKLEKTKVPINESQKNALMSLKGGLEVIHGPPGTGKSTTIWHILNSLILPGNPDDIKINRSSVSHYMLS